MKDTHLPRQDGWTAVAVRRPGLAPATAHHHYLTRPKWSKNTQESNNHDISQSAKRGFPVFKNDHRPSVASVSTVEQPLLRSSTTTSIVSAASTTTPSSEPELQRPFTEKYGRCLEILHYGSNSTVRLHQTKMSAYSSKSKQLFAIKVYRYNNNIIDGPDARGPHSYCPPSAIANLHPHHPNILSVSDLLYNERGELCLVMPFCAGGDLHELLSRSGPLSTPEADCIIVQILRALSFLHEHGTAHRDIRLETVLLTQNGAVKLAGFGDGHVKRLWNECALAPVADETGSEPDAHSPSHSTRSWSFSIPWIPFSFNHSTPAKGNTGDTANSTASFPGISLPYIPPEGFVHRPRRKSWRETIECEEDGDEDEIDLWDPRPADVWAAAIIYLALVTGRLLWRSARPHREDARYLEYLQCRSGEDGYPPIESLGNRRRNAIYAMLHPNSRRRITTKDMLRSEWIQNVSVCEAGEKGD
ncbi:Serine/threonine-protein kinase hal4 [Penicillium rolfsii]|nr:Serine/threonine-protein kinase hal4 [Penicillium rolfsii]